MRVPKHRKFIVLSLGFLVALATIIPTQVAWATFQGTVELKAIRKDTGAVLDTDGPVSFYDGSTVRLGVSFHASEEGVTTLSPLFWIVVLKILKIVTIGYGIHRGAIKANLAGAIITVAIAYLSETNYEFTVDKTGTYTFDLEATAYEGGVGGVVVSVDKFGLLAPYIGLALTILAATVASTVYVKRVKRRKEKQ